MKRQTVLALAIAAAFGAWIETETGGGYTWANWFGAEEIGPKQK